MFGESKPNIAAPGRGPPDDDKDKEEDDEEEEEGEGLGTEGTLNAGTGAGTERVMPDVSTLVIMGRLFLEVP